MSDGVNKSYEILYPIFLKKLILFRYLFFQMFFWNGNIFCNKIRRNAFPLVILFGLLLKVLEELPRLGPSHYPPSAQRITSVVRSRTIVAARNGYSRAKGFTYTFQLGYFWAKFGRKCVMKRQFAQEKALSKR